MSYVIYNVADSRIEGRPFETERAAKVSKAALVKREAKRVARSEAEIAKWGMGRLYVAREFAVCSMEHYDANLRKTKIVKNLMTGADVEIDINTPHCCDPSTETYWSM
jgi:hypothetical protein